MSVTTIPPRGTAGPVPKNYANVNYSIKSWLLTTDHKRVGILYLLSVTFLFFLGGIAAGLVRAELVTPAGDLVAAETYNKLFTMHGVLMIFFFLIPVIPATLGNFLMPLMIGARDLAFPRLNLASWYVYITGAAITLFAIFTGGVDTGWTFYTPFSSVYSNSAVIATAIGVLIVGFSSIFTAVNFIVTVHKMRAPGLTWFRLPLFVWAMYATSLIIVLGTPVVAITLILVAVERILGVGIFNPAVGGDPLLFQHLFWFYSHPAVYIMILPGMGIVSELITCFSRKRIFGYKYIALSSLAIAAYGFLVWGHHMFVSGQSVYASLVFSLLSFMVAVPSAIKVFNWTATLYKGSIWLSTPMLYALGFLGLFLVGGLTGLFLASLAVDVHVHDTYFVVAHFMYSEKWGRLGAIIIFLGFNLTFFPQFIVGYLGMPRRYHTYAPEFQFWNILSTLGSVVLALGYFLPLIYLLASLRTGKRAPANPWGATGLEWQVPSPPPTYNFRETPVVTGPPYNYSAVAAEEAYREARKQEGQRE